MPDAPLTIWLRPRPGPVTEGGWFQTLLHDELDAVEYIRKDAADAMLTHAVNGPTTAREEALLFAMGSHQRVMRSALEALEDNDVPGAEQILRTCLSQL